MIKQLKDALTTEKEKMNKMDQKVAISYIWSYYKLWIIGLLVIVGLVIYFVILINSRPKEEMLHILFVNYYDDVSQNSEFYQGYIDFDGEKDLDGSIVFDNNVFFDLKKSLEYANNYYQKTVAYLEAGTVDGVICEYDNLIGIAESGRFMDLEDVRLKNIYKKYVDRVITIESNDEIIPVGIDISDSPVLKKMNGYSNKCYLGISSNIIHIEKMESFLDYLLNQE